MGVAKWQQEDILTYAQKFSTQPPISIYKSYGNKLSGSRTKQWVPQLQISVVFQTIPAHDQWGKLYSHSWRCQTTQIYLSTVVQNNFLLLSACEEIYNHLHSRGLSIYTHTWPSNIKNKCRPHYILCHNPVHRLSYQDDDFQTQQLQPQDTKNKTTDNSDDSDCNEVISIILPT